jgi:hypothetical protein
MGPVRHSKPREHGRGSPDVLKPVELPWLVLTVTLYVI